MKKIKTTHIDTGGHGYYSVSKKDIEILGIADKISGYSGLSLSRCYLEEDCDATLLFDKAKEMGYVIILKNGYNPNFNIKHNYKPELFNWIPQIRQKVMCGVIEYTIVNIVNNKIIVENEYGNQFKLPMTNPFAFINSVLN